MRILLINQFFWPDSAPTGQLLADVANGLARRGHQVSVICGSARYGVASPAAANRPCVEIHRVRDYQFSRRIFGRMLSYVSFLAGCLWKELTLPAPDLVVTLTTPPLLPFLGTVLKWVRPRCRHYIWEMDVFPDTLVGVGVLPEHSWILRALKRVADIPRRRCDGILALGDCMRLRLARHGISEQGIHVVQNWADGGLIRPEAFRSEGPLRILYSGNLGLCHDVETVWRAIEAYANNDRFSFVFAGGGARRAALERLCQERQIRNAAFVPYSKEEEMSSHYGGAHIGLVTQRVASLGAVVPSKTYSLMAAGRPILFVGPRQATPAQLIEKFACGWQVDCGEGDSLIRLLKELESDREEVCRRGARARAVFEEHFDAPIGISRLFRALGLAPSAEAA